jgi:hypothetical protein
MTGAQWGILVPSIAGLLTAISALLHSIATRKQIPPK